MPILEWPDARGFRSVTVALPGFAGPRSAAAKRRALLRVGAVHGDLHAALREWLARIEVDGGARR